MRKLKLDDLQVDSFVTEESSSLRGTVKGHTGPCTWDDIGCTGTVPCVVTPRCPANHTHINTCAETCGDSCAVTDCNGGGNISAANSCPGGCQPGDQLSLGCDQSVYVGVC